MITSGNPVLLQQVIADKDIKLFSRLIPSIICLGVTAFKSYQIIRSHKCSNPAATSAIVLILDISSINNKAETTAEAPNNSPPGICSNSNIRDLTVGQAKTNT